MNYQSEVTAEIVESVFGETGASGRFANFCNAVIVAESIGPISSLPVLSEKAGADGSFDAEWDVRTSAAEFSNPFVELGWNVLQFKSRSVLGSGRAKAVAGIKHSLKGALKTLVARLEKPKRPKRYVLFTNLQLGQETKSTTKRGSVLSKDRKEIQAAIRKGGSLGTTIQIFDAAQLAALVNKHPALRLTYFAPSVARPWDEKWKEEQAAKNYKTSAPLVGREKELEQLRAWIADPLIKVIAICGPSGMGKTRLALEATRADHLRATIVDVVEELERWGIQSLGNPPQPRIIVVEDPTEEQANRLAKQAVSATGLKLLFTFPSESKTPHLKLTGHESVREAVLSPLSRDHSEKLLKAAGAVLDSTARDWVLRQAGGVPEILLSAAELGSGLRGKSGDLKKRLAELYRKRIEKELGREAVEVLRLLSPLHWLAVSGKTEDLSALLAALGNGVTAATVHGYLERLKKMGYLRQRGNHVSVVPPLFAAALAEGLFALQTRGMCELFDKLPDRSRERLLERAVTTDLPDQAEFWDHVFGTVLGTTEHLFANFDLLDALARAIPLRTARFLEKQIEALAEVLGPDEHSSKRGSLLSTFRELAYQQESCVVGMRLLELMALREPWQKEAQSATKLFCECFVHWYTEFPLSFQDRDRWIRQMLESANESERRLAARTVAVVTDPPHSLSGHSSNARKLGQAPATRYNRDVWDYLDHFLQMRFELTQDSDPIIAEVVQNQFVQVFQERYLPADRLVQELEKFMHWQVQGKLKADEREIRQVVHWIERRFLESSKKPEQVPHAEKWAPILERMAALRRQLDEGPFELRFRLALGRAFESDWDEVEGKREYVFQKRCQRLAEEVVANSALMSASAWNLLRERESYNAHTFIRALGLTDRDGVFLHRFKADAHDDHGSYNLGIYLAGVQDRDAKLVETELDALAAQTDFPKQSLLKPIAATGATTGNRRRLLQLIAQESVSPLGVAQLFTVGTWLREVPPSEIQTILEFIAAGVPQWPKWLIDILSLYLHPDRPLPMELLSIAERALKALNASQHEEDWDCDRVAIGIAKADLNEAFGLLRHQIKVVRQTDAGRRRYSKIWMPIHAERTSDFWEFIRREAPERTYRELLSLQGIESEIEIGLVLDLENHREVLLNLAKENEPTATFIAKLASGAQPGFFQFAYKLMESFPSAGNVAEALASAASYQLGMGFGDGDYTQALARVDAELKDSHTPKQFLGWLENLKRHIEEAAKRDRFPDREEYFLGWD